MRVLGIFSSGFALGIFLGQYLLPESIWISGCFVGLAVTALLCFFPKGHIRKRLLLLCSAFSLALGYNALYMQTVQQPMRALAGGEETVTMTLCEYPQETDWGAKVAVELPGFSRGKAVYYGDASLLSLAPGQTVTDRVSFQDASRIRDDDITAFTSKGIFLLLYSRGEAAYGTGSMDSPRWWPARIAMAMRGVIGKMLGGDTAGFLAAILTGDTGSISETGKIALSEAGLYHILAVSGMHCGYLMAIAVLLIGLHHERLLAGITIAVLAFYVLLTGGSPSVLRAFVMLSFSLIAPIFRRENDGPTSLLAALFLILLINPFAATSIGLQLSFAAMAGMLWLPGPLYRFLIPEGRSGWLVRFCVSSVCATMGALVFTIPLSSWYFGDLVLISPLSNLLCLWAAGFAFVTGLLSVTAGLIFLPLGKVLAVIPGLLIDYILGAAEVLSHIPHHAVSFANPYLKYWLVYVYILFALAWVLGGKGRRKYALSAVLAILTLVITVKAGQLQYRSGLDVIVLDVGQGQCVVLKSGDQFALVDCGSGSSWVDAGDLAAQQLRTMGCKRLDYLLLTHYDSDHVSGVPGLLTRMEVETLLLPPDADDSGLQTEILAAAQGRGSEILTIRRLHHITLGQTTMTIYPPLGEKTDNERGLSALAMSGTDTLLITGDMSQETEQLLLDTYRIPEADVLMAGHHGAKNSTSKVLLETLTPETVCISVGSNSYGHPASQTLQRLVQAGCTVWRTDLQGDIHLSLNP